MYTYIELISYFRIFLQVYCLLQNVYICLMLQIDRNNNIILYLTRLAPAGLLYRLKPTPSGDNNSITLIFYYKLQRPTRGSREDHLRIPQRGII